jgi:hypothetical protein
MGPDPKSWLTNANTTLQLFAGRAIRRSMPQIKEIFPEEKIRVVHADENYEHEFVGITIYTLNHMRICTIRINR